MPIWHAGPGYMWHEEEEQAGKEGIEKGRVEGEGSGRWVSQKRMAG